MDINRHNYEAFLLDLLEGRLSAAEEQELKEFLNAHPEHVVDMPDLDLLSLENVHLTFPDRDQLKKELPTAETPLTGNNFDLYSIARMEGDLSEQQVEAHRFAIHSDERLLQDWSRWQMTRLVPERIQFPGKKSLKRRKNFRARMVIMGVLSTAAVLTLLLLLFKMNPADPADENSRISAVVSPSIKQEPVEDQEEILAMPEQETREEVLAMPEQETREEVLAMTEEENQAMPGQKDQAMPEEEASTLITETDLAAADQGIASALEEPVEEQAGVVQGSEQNLAGPRPLRIAQQLTSNPDLISMNAQDRIEPLKTDPVSPKLKSYSVTQLAEMDRQTLIRDFADEHNISLMSVANAGIKGINKLTGSEISLLASRDEEGEVSGFQFKSKRLSIRSPIGREE